MTKKPETVKEEDLITRLEDGTISESREPYTGPSGKHLLERPKRRRKPRRRRKKDGLVYKKDSKVPFTGAVEKSIESFVLDTTINLVAYYKDGKRTGLYESYYENGHLSSRENIKTDHIYDGLQEYYYDNGQLDTSENFKDDLRDGPRTTYRPNGSIIFDQKFKKGKLHGPKKYYEENKEGSAYLRSLDHHKNGERRSLLGKGSS